MVQISTDPLQLLSNATFRHGALAEPAYHSTESVGRRAMAERLTATAGSCQGRYRAHGINMVAIAAPDCVSLLGRL
ncbi:MAG: hypothetical protein DRI90_25555 [Deltaproteobacteria bacterium]|nr:MAG: hypothetical protein DRI90_25555 [Deltaproteobacteria bacterium]